MMIFSELKHYFFNLLVIGKSISGDYKFTLHDHFHYLRFAESPGPQNKFPSIFKTGEDTVFIKFKIGSFSYYWPRNISLNGLTWMYQEVFESSSDNPHAYEYEKIQINTGDNVIDAGACEGFFTRYALGKGATIIAIEPVKILAEALERTFSEEIKRGQVSIINAALGSSRTMGYLSSETETIFESHLAICGDIVNIITLDDFITTKVNFIKMDIEGGEVDALYGAQNIILQYKPKLSIAVYHKYENAQIIMDYLRELCPEYTIKHRGIYAYNDEKPRPMMVYASINVKEKNNKE